MNHVAAHKAEIEYSSEELERRTASLIFRDRETASRDMSWASSSAIFAFSHGAWGLAIGQNVAARRLFSLGVDYAVGAFLAVKRPGEPIQFTVDGETIHAHGVDGKTRTPKPFDWIACTSMAICLRRTDALMILTSFPVERLERGDAFWTGLCLALQRFISGDPTWPKFAAEAIELTQQAKYETPKTIAQYMSIVPTLHAIEALDQGAFTDALVRMLQAHKAQASRGRAKDSGPSLFALPACGMAALGLQRGLLLDVESGYMPAWLVKNEAP